MNWYELIVFLSEYLDLVLLGSYGKTACRPVALGGADFRGRQVLLSINLPTISQGSAGCAGNVQALYDKSFCWAQVNGRNDDHRSLRCFKLSCWKLIRTLASVIYFILAKVLKGTLQVWDCSSVG
jgi:hypothetical protein